MSITRIALNDSSARFTVMASSPGRLVVVWSIPVFQDDTKIGFPLSLFSSNSAANKISVLNIGAIIHYSIFEN